MRKILSFRERSTRLLLLTCLLCLVAVGAYGINYITVSVNIANAGKVYYIKKNGDKDGRYEPGGGLHDGQHKDSGGTKVSCWSNGQDKVKFKAEAAAGYKFVSWTITGEYNSVTGTGTETIEFDGKTEKHAYVTANFEEITPSISLSDATNKLSNVWTNQKTINIVGYLSNLSSIEKNSDAYKVYCEQVSGGSFNAFLDANNSWNRNFTASSEGTTTYTMTVKHKNNANKFTSVDFIHKYDATAPLYQSHTFHNTYEDGSGRVYAKCGGNASVTLNYNDATSGVGTWVVGNKTSNNSTVGLTVSFAGVIEHKIYAKDLAGNKSAENKITYNVDGTAPVVSETEGLVVNPPFNMFIDGKGKVWVRAGATLTYGCTIADPDLQTDVPGSGFDYATFKGVQYNKTDGIFVIDTSKDLYDNKDSIIAIDNVGCESKTPLPAFGIDGSGPQIKVANPLVAIDTLSGVKSVQYYNGEEFVDYKGKFEMKKAGEFTFTAIDNLDNVTSITLVASENLRQISYNDTIISYEPSEDGVVDFKELPKPKTLAPDLFKDNPNINKVELPETLEELGDSVFKNCTNLDTLYINSYPIKLGEDAFENIKPGAKFYIDNNDYQKYLNDDQWKKLLAKGIIFEQIVKIQTYKPDSVWGWAKEEKGKFSFGEEVMLTAMPKTTDYLFVKWQHEDGRTSTDSCYTFTIGNKADTVTAVFTDTLRIGGLCYQTIKNGKNEVQLISDPNQAYGDSIYVPATISQKVCNITRTFTVTKIPEQTLTDNPALKYINLAGDWNTDSLTSKQGLTYDFNGNVTMGDQPFVNYGTFSWDFSHGNPAILDDFSKLNNQGTLSITTTPDLKEGDYVLAHNAIAPLPDSKKTFTLTGEDEAGQITLGAQKYYAYNHMLYMLKLVGTDLVLSALDPRFQIGEKIYAFMTDALEEVQVNDTMIVLKDTKLSETAVITSAMKFTLDLNCHYLSGDTIATPETEGQKASVIYNEGALTITKGALRSGKGTLIGSKLLGSAIYNNAVINITDTLILRNAGDSIYNSKNATLNWILKDDVKYGKVYRYGNIRNDGGKLTVTVNNRQKIADYVLGVGDLSDLSGKNTFTVKLAHDNGKQIKVGDSILYKGRMYMLKVVEAAAIAAKAELNATKAVKMDTLVLVCTYMPRIIVETDSTKNLDMENEEYIAAPYKYHGGAVYVYDRGTFNAKQTVFYCNEAKLGAAIYNTGTTNLFNVKFIGNKAKMGGAIYNFDGIVNINGAIVLTNDSDTWVNEGYKTGAEPQYAVTNWTLGKTPNDNKATLVGYENFANYGHYAKQTITVAKNQTQGSYLIATGDFSNVENKDKFYITGVEGQEDIAVFIGGATKNYDGQGYTLKVNGRELYLEIGEPLAKIDVAVSSMNKATIYSDKNLVVPAGVRVFGMKWDDSKNMLVCTNSRAYTDGDILPAEMGYVIEAPAATYSFLETEQDASVVSLSELSGVVVETPTDEVEGTVFTLANGYNGVGFYTFVGETLKANKAFYNSTNPNLKGYLGCEDTTGIETSLTPTLSSREGVYNLQGQQVNNNYRGVVIKNGKKVIMK